MTFYSKIKNRKGLIAKISFVIRSLAQLVFKILVAPLQLLESLRRLKLRELMFALPPLLTLAFLAFVLFRVFAGSTSIEQRYRSGAVVASLNGENSLAQTYFQRIISEHELDDADQYQWAVILAKNGEPDRSNEIFNFLAPDSSQNRPGFALAHRYKAITLVQSLDKANRNDGQLKELKWHLENTIDDDPEIQKAWATYFLANEQYDEAIGVLSKSAHSDPQLNLVISKIHEQMGQMGKRDSAIKQAESIYRARLEKNQLDRQSRISLVDVLVFHRNFDEAERLLKVGLQIQPDPEMKFAASNYYVKCFDLIRSGTGTIEQQLELLFRAMKLDPNNGVSYQRFAEMIEFMSISDEALALIKQGFQNAVAGDHPNSLTHLGLSNIYWHEKAVEKSKFHLERAIALDPDFALVINNYAVLLCQHDRETSDFNRSLQLVKTVLERSPDDAHFLETHGEVLFKLEKWEEGVQELKKALNELADDETNDRELRRILIHEKLALAYAKLQKNELAKSHLEKAQQLRAK